MRGYPRLSIAYEAFLAAVGAPLIVLAVLGSWGAPDPAVPWLTVLLLVGALALAEGAHFPSPHGYWKSLHGPYTVALMLLAPLAVPVMVGVLPPLLMTVVGRDRIPLRSAVINVWISTIHLAAARGAYCLVAGESFFVPSVPHGWRQYAAVAVAGVVLIAITSLLISVMAWVRGRGPWQPTCEAADVAEACLIPVTVAAAIAAAPLVFLVWGSSFLLQRSVVLAAEREYEALHDDLTGLPNRSQLQQRFTRRGRGPAPTALVALDLDRFKQVNDTLGHAAGDELLCQVAGRIRATLREGDLAVRLGGDEFVVLLHEHAATAAEEARVVAGRLIDALAEPFELVAGSAVIGASAGITTDVEAERGLAACLRDADLALYAAKTDRGRWVHHDTENAATEPVRARMTTEPKKPAPGLGSR